MPWKAGDECWAIYCDNVDGVGLKYVPGLVGVVAAVDGGDTLVIRRTRPGPKGEVLQRLHAAGRAWTSRAPADAYCAERVGPYGPSMGKGGMSVPGNGWAPSK